ncbi:DinB family protein [Iamia sp. SCSIO 61187]|uniref:DinB family protein n=1 Tax=Iamia sp. SCSIO 61187 TaxID=2722752 RepID=UPI001C634ACC|nr:DinB family protein [Iamia sp. SCSIO 61187]QYG91555.1 DinB family protein [Iamia sp. SCSIO 61187]
MDERELKDDLHGYLEGARAALLWKLEGLGEYDVRRPLTPTGTNLLGLVKHNAGTHLGYFGDVFGRPHDVPLPWLAGDAEPDADMWAAADESREDILELHRRAREVADATIGELPLDAVGRVPWWGDGAVTLHHILVHVTADTQRHAGHADIVRELIDGSAGLLPGHGNLPAGDAAWWAEHRARVEAAARLATGG